MLLASKKALLRRVGDLPIVSANFAQTGYDYSTPSWIDNTGTTGNRMVTDSTGALTWAPGNMLLNSATLSTQSITTLAQNYILSFYGTGSVTCSGTNATVVNGTGAGNRVSAVLTCTAGTLTLTVSGSVTSAQVEAVTYQTSPRNYIPTTGAAVYLPRYDYDGLTSPATPRGMLIEPAGSNLIPASNGFSTWSLSNLTVTSPGTMVAPDGTTAAVKIAATANGATSCFLFVNSAGSTSGNSFSVYMKKGTSATKLNYVGLRDFTTLTPFVVAIVNLDTGAITYDTGASGATATNVGGGWWRVTISLSGIAAGDRLLAYVASTGQTYAAGDYVWVWGAQLESGLFASSMIPTTSGSAARVADVVGLSGTALGVAGAATGSAIVQSLWKEASIVRDLLSSATTRRLLYSNSSNTVVSSTNGTTNLSATIGGAGTFTGSSVRSGIAWNPYGRSVVANNGTLVSDSVSLSTGATVTLGGYGTTITFGGWIASVAFYNRKLSDASLKQKSVVGVPY